MGDLTLEPVNRRDGRPDPRIRATTAAGKQPCHRPDRRIIEQLPFAPTDQCLAGDVVQVLLCVHSHAGAGPTGLSLTCAEMSMAMK